LKVRAPLRARITAAMAHHEYPAWTAGSAWYPGPGPVAGLVPDAIERRPAARCRQRRRSHG